MSQSKRRVLDMLCGPVAYWLPRQKVDLTRYTEMHEFIFDNVFHERATTEEVGSGASSGFDFR